MMVAPEIEVLGEEESLALIAGKSVGRVALSVRALPTIVPVDYVLVGRTVYVWPRLRPELGSAVPGTVIAFEVGHLEQERGEPWTVLVTGVAELADDPAVRSVVEALDLGRSPRGKLPHPLRLRVELVEGRRMRRPARSEDPYGK